jgi:pilus assembly protein CpaB
MRARGLLLIGISLILGVLAVLWLRSGAAPPPQAAAPSAQTIVVAASELHFGDHVTADKLRAVPWPQESVPAGAYKTIAAFSAEGKERIALQTIEAGEPMLPGKISENGARATLSSVIQGDMRAVTLRVNDTTGVAGFVLPNDHVDVLLTRGTDRDNSRTEILLQNVRVLAVDQVATQGSANKGQSDKPMLAKVVTVEVSPLDAEKLTLAQQVGTLSLALRNYTSTHTVSNPAFSVAGLDPSQKKEAPKTAAPPVATATPITVFHGVSNK